MHKDWIQLFGRLAIGTILLSAVSDRFGLWGAHGTANVAWGDFSHFTMYTAQVNAFLPSAFAPALAVLSTIAEASLGIALIIGIWTRGAAIGAALLFALFGIAMTISFGVKRPLDYSVFTDCAAAVFLAAVPYYRWSLDSLNTPRSVKASQ
jgi:putative oxidoreductase